MIEHQTQAKHTTLHGNTPTKHKAGKKKPHDQSLNTSKEIQPFISILLFFYLFLLTKYNGLDASWRKSSSGSI